MIDYILPDYKNSNINISSTLAKFLGAPNDKPNLPLLEEELNKGYKNVVFICFDGMGINPIQINLEEDDLLRKNIKATLVSTFPSTTTNATTSLMENKYPLEHGWFGWSMNYKDIGKNVNIFLDTDSWTGLPLNIKNSPLGAIDYYFDHAKSEYRINTLFPEYVKVNRPDRNTTYEGMNEFFLDIKRITKRSGKQFIYAYYPEPDSTMHEEGVTSAETKRLIRRLSYNMGRLLDSTEDTLFVITADHGQVDIEGYVELYSDTKLMDMLEIYPFLEARAPAFIVKKGREKEFEEYFTSTYGEDFELHKSSELIDKGYFGDIGDKAHLLGDYIAIGTYTHKQAVLVPVMPRFKGHHTSLTEEMLVPLILLNNKK